jgi:hypothetical protein
MVEWWHNLTRSLSRKELLFYVVGALFLAGVAAGVRTYVYPWLGVPAVGVSGFAPFLLAWALVAFVLLKLPSLRKNELLAMLLAVPLSVGIVVALLSAYGKFASN